MSENIFVAHTEQPMSLKPCPFCGGTSVQVRENRTNNTPRMDGKRWPIMTVQIDHQCPRSPDEAGNFPVLGAGVHFRGRDHASVEHAWNERATTCRSDKALQSIV